MEDLKWVSLMLFAGADPRTSGPSLTYDGDIDDSDDCENRTALEAAAHAKDVRILKRLKPDKQRDDIDKLLAEAGTFGREDSVRYLLELGANPNNKQNGGSSALEGCLTTSLRCESFRWEISRHWYGPLPKASKSSVSKTLNT